MAVVLSMVIWIGWQKIYLEPIQHQQTEHARQQQLLVSQRAKEVNPQGAGVPGSVSAAAPDLVKLSGLKRDIPLEIRKIDNGVSSVSASNGPGLLHGWELLTFSKTLDDTKDKIGLKTVTGFDQQLFIRTSDNERNPALGLNWQSVAASDRTVRALWSAQGWEFERALSLDETGYGGELKINYKFSEKIPAYVFIDLFGSPKRENDTEGSIFGQAPDKVHLTYRDAQGRHMEIAASHEATKETAAGVKWLGLDTRYFVLALVPAEPLRSLAGAQLVRDDRLGAPAIRGSLVFPTGGKSEGAISAKIYFGPKEMASLQKVDPILADTIDFGWTSVIAIPILKSLKWLYSYVHNYGIAIIILTIIIKIMLFPLTYKSMKSMAKIAKLQPQLNALREKYKDDKEKLNAEMMSFMKTQGYNPVGGCLPILLQMPIFFALYRVLFNSIELYQTPFYLWIRDLSSPDPWFVTPVLLMGLMYLQQKLSPSTVADPVQQKMLQWMPVVFGVFMLLLPAGLNIYMVVNSATSILQQWILNKKLGITPMAPAAPAPNKA
jgi:YidC/Oxa1 family membrane protein insertase